MYISLSIVLSTFASIFAISFKNFILSDVFSKLISFFRFLTLNSTNDIALSIANLNLPSPNFTINSSGSFAPSICNTLMSHPIFCSISIDLATAVCPAPSASNPSITCSVLFLNNQPCCSVNAVPNAATTFFTPLWCNDMTSIYPSTINSLLLHSVFAIFSPNKCLPLLYTTFSGEFIYFGFESSKTLPPNAITFPLISHIGIISLFLYMSIYCPLSFLMTSPDSNISFSLKPWAFNCLYNSSNLPENPILYVSNVDCVSFLFFTYSCAIFAVGLYKF